MCHSCCSVRWAYEWVDVTCINSLTPNEPLNNHYFRYLRLSAWCQTPYKKRKKKCARKNNAVTWTIRSQQNMLQWNLIKNTNISTRNMVSFVCKNAMPFCPGANLLMAFISATCQHQFSVICTRTKMILTTWSFLKFLMSIGSLEKSPPPKNSPCHHSTCWWPSTVRC